LGLNDLGRGFNQKGERPLPSAPASVGAKVSHPSELSWLVITVARFALAILIAVGISVDGTDTCRVLIPIVIGDYAHIRRRGIGVQVLINIRVGFDYAILWRSVLISGAPATASSA
jgi:hypothetical protein